jgi:hypothetical protein
MKNKKDSAVKDNGKDNILKKQSIAFSTIITIGLFFKPIYPILVFISIFFFGMCMSKYFSVIKDKVKIETLVVALFLVTPILSFITEFLARNFLNLAFSYNPDIFTRTISFYQGLLALIFIILAFFICVCVDFFSTKSSLKIFSLSKNKISITFIAMSNAIILFILSSLFLHPNGELAVYSAYATDSLVKDCKQEEKVDVKNSDANINKILKTRVFYIDQDSVGVFINEKDKFIFKSIEC